MSLQRYKPYMKPGGRNGGKLKPRSLKDLAKQHLGITIQTGEHDPGVVSAGFECIFWFFCDLYKYFIELFYLYCM